MIRTQISLPEDEYRLAKQEASTLGISVAEFVRRYDSRRALQFLNFIDELSPLVMIAFGAEEAGQATAVIKRFHNQDLTLADAHGLAIMSQRRHTTCWSTDRHLALAGAALVIYARGRFLVREQSTCRCEHHR